MRKLLRFRTCSPCRMPRPLLSMGLCAILFVLPLQVSAQGQIPTPESVLGFQVGADYKLAGWPQILDYFDRLDRASDRIQVETIGASTEGRRFILVLISDPENLSRKAEIQAVQKRLADPRGLADEDARKIAETGKVVVLAGCNIHATEIASSQMSMELAYELAVQDDPVTRSILQDVVLLLVPSLNPDGIDIVVDWYGRTLGTPYEGSGPPYLYHKYTGHDNNRDWFMLTQAESRIMNRIHYRVWFPQIIYDIHQMGNKGARFFVPPFFDPPNPNLPPLLQRQIMMLGSHMALDLAAEGKTGVITSAMYDTWWHGGYRSVPYRHNIVGILSEAASVNIASPIFQRVSELKGHRRGLNRYEIRTNFPEPWPGGWWRLRDIVEYEKTAVRSVLKVAARYRSDWLTNFYRLGKEAVEKGEQEPPYAYLIPPDQHDPVAAAEMLGVLKLGGVEIHRAEEAFRADGVSYPRGTYVIKMAQPYRAHAKDLLERQHYPDRRLYEGGPPERPYDVVGWTLPLQMGVRAVEAVRPFEARLSPADPTWPKYPFPSAGAGYLLANRTNHDIVALNRLLPEGFQAYWVPESIRAGQKRIGPGAIWLPSANGLEPRLRALSDSLGIEVLSGRKPARGYRLNSPRLGLYQPWTANIDEGWTRWVLERFGFQYATVHDAEVRAGSLNARYDVLILPNMGASRLLKGNAPGSRPPEYTGGIGDVGADNLVEFVHNGGTLICLGNVSRFALDRFDIGVRDTLAGRREDRPFYCPGSILQVEMDISHPLGYGRPQQMGIYFAQNPAFSCESASLSVARYPGFNPLMSGWISGEERIQGRTALVDAPFGKGNVILFGFRPQHRAQPHATFKILFNAIYYGAAEPDVPIR